MEPGHASRAAAQPEQLVDFMGKMGLAASGQRSMEVMEQQYNSRSAEVRGIAVAENEGPGQMQGRVSGLVAGLGLQWDFWL